MKPTTKEDQMRAAWEVVRPELGGYADVVSFNYGYKACAESYEKKLAMLVSALEETGDREIRLTHTYVAELEQLQAQLSEANARNARLSNPNDVVELAEKIFGGKIAVSQMPFFIAFAEAITADSESVAAWEAEKLEPLCRDVAMLLPFVTILRSHIGGALHTLDTDELELARSCDAAINNTQATAEAYEREVQAKVWDEAEKMCELIGDEYTEREGRKYPELRSDATTGAYSCMAAARTKAYNFRAANKGKE